MPSSSDAQRAGEEVLDRGPALDRGLRPVARAVDREEAVAGVLVDVELVVLTIGAQRLRELLDLLRRGVGVLGAEQSQERAGQVEGAVDERLHLQREALRRRPDDARAVAVDGGVQRQAGRGEEGLPAAGAVAD